MGNFGRWDGGLEGSWVHGAVMPDTAGIVELLHLWREQWFRQDDSGVWEGTTMELMKAIQLLFGSVDFAVFVSMLAHDKPPTFLHV